MFPVNSWPDHPPQPGPPRGLVPGSARGASASFGPFHAPLNCDFIRPSALQTVTHKTMQNDPRREHATCADTSGDLGVFPGFRPFGAPLLTPSPGSIYPLHLPPPTWPPCGASRLTICLPEILPPGPGPAKTGAGPVTPPSERPGDLRLLLGGGEVIFASG